MASMLATSPHRAESLLLSEAKVATMSSLFPDATLYIASRAVLDAVVGFAFHRGVLVLARRAPQPTIREWLERHSQPGVVVAERISSYDNLGSIVRSMSVLAPPGTGLMLSPGCCDPLYRKTLRVSMGHALHVPCIQMPHYPTELKQLRDAGFMTVALTPDSRAADLTQIEIPRGRRPALLLGAEGPGLDHQTLFDADIRARIPMRSGVDSLNVAVAGAIAMHRLWTCPGGTTDLPS